MTLNMTMKVVFEDGTWIRGIRKWYWVFTEIGTHHFRVTETSPTLQDLVAKKVAVPISKPKYFILESGLLS